MKIWYSDFETGKDDKGAYVWSAATIDNFDNFFIESNINSFMRAVIEECPDIIYFHNLKFDGNFILNYLENSKLWNTCWNEDECIFEEFKYMHSMSYKYLISADGVWYNIILKVKNKKITILDSLKLAPMSLKEAGKAFHTEHQKLEMNFSKNFTRNYIPSENEKKYIKNDVLVLKEFVEKIRESGLNKTTIGSCCLDFFKKSYDKEDFKDFFPNVYEMEIDGVNVGKFIEKSYHGAFVYVNKYKQGKIVKNGRTYDVNSLYPYVMHSKSGFLYPYGKPIYWKNDIPDFKKRKIVTFLHFSCRFYLKDGFLPFIHIRNNPLYNANENLETSCIKNGNTYSRFYYDDVSEEVKDTQVELYMNEFEFELFKTHYKICDLKIIDGFTFYGTTGFFDNYIDYWFEKKANATGSERTIAKLYLNNLYGKFAAKPDSSFKVAKEFENGLKFKTIKSEDKTPGYMPIGSLITSYAMIYTVTQAQKVYHKSKEGFCYSDTDSIHVDGDFDSLFNISETRLGWWDKELEWKEGKFLRQKSYIEVDYNGVYHITCAGMSAHCKNLFRKSLGENVEINLSELTEKEKNFIKKKRNLKNFDFGLEIYGKLRPVQTKGGMYLEKTSFKIRKKY